MAKFYGQIGFAISSETAPGVWDERIVERSYCGDLVRNLRRLETSKSTNEDININNEISIVSDPFAQQNFHSMRYITYLGTKWKINSVEVKYPRLILSIGGIYQ